MRFHNEHMDRHEYMDFHGYQPNYIKINDNCSILSILFLSLSENLINLNAIAV